MEVESASQPLYRDFKRRRPTILAVILRITHNLHFPYQFSEAIAVMASSPQPTKED
jgi:ABC-type dipeptide/oligopeptide/nickel transport system ATPase component